MTQSNAATQGTQGWQNMIYPFYWLVCFIELTISVPDAPLAASPLETLVYSRSLLRFWQVLPFEAFQLIIILCVEPLVVYGGQAE